MPAILVACVPPYHDPLQGAIQLTLHNGVCVCERLSALNVESVQVLVVNTLFSDTIEANSCGQRSFEVVDMISTTDADANQHDSL